MSRSEFEFLVSPKTVLAVGGMPYTKVARAIELLATKVAPVVRRELAR
jgi:hypothetical protein